MPPKKSTKASNQSTLAFHGAQSRITKPNARIDTKSKIFTSSKPGAAKPPSKREESPVSIEAEQIAEDELPPTTAEQAIVEQAEEAKAEVSRTEEEEEASKVSDARIKKYWREKENERIAPRVHQGDLSLHQKILRQWDTSAQYGPCIGIARLKRWKRAHRLGLEPPIEVLAVLLKDQDDDRVQRAHVDELMSSRFVAQDAVDR